LYVNIKLNCSIYLFICVNRSKEMGASVSAARSLFELFDRTPLIDNGSTKGQELVITYIYSLVVNVDNFEI